MLDFDRIKEICEHHRNNIKTEDAPQLISGELPPPSPFFSFRRAGASDIIFDLDFSNIVITTTSYTNKKPLGPKSAKKSQIYQYIVSISSRLSAYQDAKGDRFIGRDRNIENAVLEELKHWCAKFTVTKNFKENLSEIEGRILYLRALCKLSLFPLPFWVGNKEETMLTVFSEAITSLGEARQRLLHNNYPTILNDSLATTSDEITGIITDLARFLTFALNNTEGLPTDAGEVAQISRETKNESVRLIERTKIGFLLISLIKMPVVQNALANHDEEAEDNDLAENPFLLLANGNYSVRPDITSVIEAHPKNDKGNPLGIDSAFLVPSYKPDIEAFLWLHGFLYELACIQRFIDKTSDLAAKKGHKAIIRLGFVTRMIDTWYAPLCEMATKRMESLDNNMLTAYTTAHRKSGEACPSKIWQDKHHLAAKANTLKIIESIKILKTNLGEIVALARPENESRLKKETEELTNTLVKNTRLMVDSRRIPLSPTDRKLVEDFSKKIDDKAVKKEDKPNKAETLPVPLAASVENSAPQTVKIPMVDGQSQTASIETKRHDSKESKYHYENSRISPAPVAEPSINTTPQRVSRIEEQPASTANANTQTQFPPEEKRRTSVEKKKEAGTKGAPFSSGSLGFFDQKNGKNSGENVVENKEEKYIPIFDISNIPEFKEEDREKEAYKTLSQYSVRSSNDFCEENESGFDSTNIDNLQNFLKKILLKSSSDLNLLRANKKYYSGAKFRGLDIDKLILRINASIVEIDKSTSPLNDPENIKKLTAALWRLIKPNINPISSKNDLILDEDLYRKSSQSILELTSILQLAHEPNSFIELSKASKENKNILSLLTSYPLKLTNANMQAAAIFSTKDMKSTWLLLRIHFLLSFIKNPKDLDAFLKGLSVDARKIVVTLLAQKIRNIIKSTAGLTWLINNLPANFISILPDLVGSNLLVELTKDSKDFGGTLNFLPQELWGNFIKEIGGKNLQGMIKNAEDFSNMFALIHPALQQNFFNIINKDFIKSIVNNYQDFIFLMSKIRDRKLMKDIIDLITMHRIVEMLPDFSTFALAAGNKKAVDEQILNEIMNVLGLPFLKMMLEKRIMTKALELYVCMDFFDLEKQIELINGLDVTCLSKIGVDPEKIKSLVEDREIRPEIGQLLKVKLPPKEEKLEQKPESVLTPPVILPSVVDQIVVLQQQAVSPSSTPTESKSHAESHPNTPNNNHSAKMAGWALVGATSIIAGAFLLSTAFWLGIGLMAAAVPVAVVGGLMHIKFAEKKEAPVIPPVSRPTELVGPALSEIPGTRSLSQQPNNLAREEVVAAII